MGRATHRHEDRQGERDRRVDSKFLVGGDWNINGNTIQRASEGDEKHERVRVLLIEMSFESIGPRAWGSDAPAQTSCWRQPIARTWHFQALGWFAGSSNLVQNTET